MGLLQPATYVSIRDIRRDQTCVEVIEARTLETTEMKTRIAAGVLLLTVLLRHGRPGETRRPRGPRPSRAQGCRRRVPGPGPRQDHRLRPHRLPNSQVVFEKRKWPYTITVERFASNTSSDDDTQLRIFFQGIFKNTAPDEVTLPHAWMTFYDRGVKTRFRAYLQLPICAALPPAEGGCA